MVRLAEQEFSEMWMQLRELQRTSPSDVAGALTIIKRYRQGIAFVVNQERPFDEDEDARLLRRSLLTSRSHRLSSMGLSLHMLSVLPNEEGAMLDQPVLLSVAKVRTVLRRVILPNSTPAIIHLPCGIPLSGDECTSDFIAPNYVALKGLRRYLDPSIPYTSRGIDADGVPIYDARDIIVVE